MRCAWLKSNTFSKFPNQVCQFTVNKAEKPSEAVFFVEMALCCLIVIPRLDRGIQGCLHGSRGQATG